MAKLPHSPEVILGTISANLFRYHESVCQHVHQNRFVIYMILDGWIIWTHNVIFITVLPIHPSRSQHIIACVCSGYINLRLAGSHAPVYSEYLANHCITWCDAVVYIGIWVKYTYGEVQAHLIEYPRQFHFIIFSGYIRLVTLIIQGFTDTGAIMWLLGTLKGILEDMGNTDWAPFYQHMD